MQAMHTHCKPHRFHHPTNGVSLKTIEEVSGGDLRCYSRPAVLAARRKSDDEVLKPSSGAGWIGMGEKLWGDGAGDGEHKPECMRSACKDFILPGD